MTWWRELYKNDVADLLLERRSDRENRALAKQIADLLALEPGARVLDQCCGTGGIAAALGDLGFAVVGVDQAASYIDRARRRAPRAELRCADADGFVADPPCAGAFNWGTSFGYGATDEDNRRMLRAAFASLEPGGRFALDVMALPGVLRGFQEVMVDRRGELHLIRRTAVDLERGLMRKQWTFLHPERETVTRESAIRLYLPHQIGGLLAGVGFADLEYFAAPDRRALTIDAPRCVILARRPA